MKICGENTCNPFLLFLAIGLSSCCGVSSFSALFMSRIPLYFTLFRENIFLAAKVFRLKIYGSDSLHGRNGEREREGAFSILNIYCTNFFKLLTVLHDSIHWTSIYACVSFTHPTPSSPSTLSSHPLRFSLSPLLPSYVS